MNDLKQTFRRERLSLLLESHFDGNKAELGKFLGYKNGAFVWQMVNGERPISEKTVERIQSNRAFKDWFADVPADPAVGETAAMQQISSDPVVAEIVQMLLQTDEIGRGKALYAVKEIVQLRRVFTDSMDVGARAVQVKAVPESLKHKIGRKRDAVTERVSEIVGGGSRIPALPEAGDTGAKKRSRPR